MLVAATPAAAHDELVASSPAAGAQLTDAPNEVTLTFSADVLTIGAAVIVVDGSGRDWVAGEPTVSSGTVTVPLDSGMPAAGYEIRWRVVSEDGHPISGLVPFTVGDAAPLQRTPSPTAQSTQSAESADGVQDQSAQEDQGALRVLLVGAGGAVFAAAAYALFHIIRRKKGTSV